MSDTESKLLARLAAMEAELATLRKPATPQTPQFDVAGFVRDPIGTMSRMGIPTDHVTRVLVAHAMGDQAPPELKVLAAMGPQMSATHALDAKVEALSRQLSDLSTSQNRSGVRESWKALTADKTKYPHLAKAAAADPSLFDEEIAGHGGTAEELATRIEARITKIHNAISPPPASDENAVTSVPSTQDKPAPLATTTSGGVPPIPQTPAGVFTPEQHTRLRDEIVRKYAK